MNFHLFWEQHFQGHFQCLLISNIPSRTCLQGHMPWQLMAWSLQFPVWWQWFIIFCFAEARRNYQIRRENGEKEKCMGKTYHWYLPDVDYYADSDYYCLGVYGTVGMAFLNSADFFVTCNKRYFSGQGEFITIIFVQYAHIIYGSISFCYNRGNDGKSTGML